MSKTHYPLVCWVFKSYFPFKVRQHSQQQFYLQYKVCRIPHKVLLHIHNPTWWCNHPYNFHQKSIPLFQTIFTFLFSTYLFAKSSLQSPLRLPYLYFCVFSPLKNLHEKIFTCLSHLADDLLPPSMITVITGLTLIRYCSGSENWCIVGSGL